MRRVADGQQTRTPPAGQPVERNRQQLDLVPVLQRADHWGELGGGMRYFLAERINALRLDRFGRSLGDDIGALPIVAPVDLYDHGPRTECTAGLVCRRLLLRKPE